MQFVLKVIILKQYLENLNVSFQIITTLLLIFSPHFLNGSQYSNKFLKMQLYR